MNSSRMNRLEELGRVDAEKADTSKGKRNLKDEKKRIINSLANGGMVKKALKKLAKEIKKNPLPKKTKDIGKRFTEAFKSKGKK